MPDASPQSRPPLTRARRIGRRSAQVLYYAVVSGIAVAATVQVSQQIFYPEPSTEPLPYATCREGLAALYQAVELARGAAEQSGLPEDEEIALARFRAAVAPAWDHRQGVASLCRSEPGGKGVLDAIERLRYSEEHGVRSQATELAALRRRVRRMVDQHVGPSPSVAPSPEHAPAPHPPPR